MKTKEIILPEGWEVDEVEDGKIVLKEKKKELPETWEECFDKLEDKDWVNNWSEVTIIKRKLTPEKENKNILPAGFGKPILALCQLLVCRNAWWKQLHYKPNWLDHNEKKYCVHAIDGYVTWSTHSQFPRILAFPTQEVCKEFKEAFKDLIEEAKELL